MFRNGTDWQPFYREDAGTGGTVTAHTYPQEVTGRYVRMRGVERATPHGYSLYAFKVYGGTPAPAATARANLALHHPAYSNTYQHAGNSRAEAWPGTSSAAWAGGVAEAAATAVPAAVVSRVRLERSRGPAIPSGESRQGAPAAWGRGRLDQG